VVFADCSLAQLRPRRRSQSGGAARNRPAPFSSVPARRLESTVSGGLARGLKTAKKRYAAEQIVAKLLEAGRSAVEPCFVVPAYADFIFDKYAATHSPAAMRSAGGIRLAVPDVDSKHESPRHILLLPGAVYRRQCSGCVMHMGFEKETHNQIGLTLSGA
jgi:hypothetical protein